MSEALYDKGGLRFWTAREILFREQAIELAEHAMTSALCGINSAWSFHRLDGPLLTPRSFINPAYTADDIFALDAKLGEHDAALRAETTASSYLYAQHLMKSGLARMPTCIWQAGKSFRQERQDGARASTLRYNEFYQLEFQCIFSNTTKAPLREMIEPQVASLLGQIVAAPTRIVPSDRLPSYATTTNDVETMWNGDWKEIASISTRTDYPDEKALVLEVAIGLDRLVAIKVANINKPDPE